MTQKTSLLLCISSCVLSCGFAFTLHKLSDKDIAYVNTDKLLDSYRAMASARREYQVEKQEWVRNLRTLADEAQQAAQRSQAAPATASLQQEARLKQQQFLNYQQAVLRQDPEEMQRLTQPVVQAANRFIAQYSQTHHYALVLSSAGQGDVVYATPALDITAQVTAALNQHLTDSLARTSNRAKK